MPRGPWPVGTLLAYRIMSSNSERVRSSGIWNKYVLLRVVKVEPFFGSKTKSMAVCLYDWIGDSLPDPEIAKELSFTYIEKNEPMLKGLGADCILRNTEKSRLPHEKETELLSNLTKPSYTTFVLMSHNCCKGIDRHAVFTPLACDPSFEGCVPAIYDENRGGITLTHSIPFDAQLVNRFCEGNP